MATIPHTVDDAGWETWPFADEAVLCFVRQKGRMMLIRKKQGLGAGKVNAPGGRVEKGETAVTAAIRETQEETGVTPADLRIVAELDFIFVDGYSLRAWVFIAARCCGVPTATVEADPFWCQEELIPYGEMWADDRHWLPRVLGGQRVRGRFIFDGDRMLSRRVTPISERSLAERSARLRRP